MKPVQGGKAWLPASPGVPRHSPGSRPSWCGSVRTWPRRLSAPSPSSQEAHGVPCPAGPWTDAPEQVAIPPLAALPPRPPAQRAGSGVPASAVMTPTATPASPRLPSPGVPGTHMLPHPHRPPSTSMPRWNAPHPRDRSKQRVNLPRQQDMFGQTCLTGSRFSRPGAERRQRLPKATGRVLPQHRKWPNRSDRNPHRDGIVSRSYCWLGCASGQGAS